MLFRILTRLLRPACSIPRCALVNPVTEFARRSGEFAHSSPTSPHYLVVRKYAKGKDKGKEKKKNVGQVLINTAEIEELVSVEKLRSRCAAAIDKMRQEFIKNLSIRSTTGSIESLRVKFDGKEYELQELAQIVRKNPKTIVMNFASFPTSIPYALKSMQASGLNLNPQQDGTTLFIPVPKVTKEHREALAKNAHMIYIKCRNAIKDVENDNLKTVRKEKNEDLSQRVQIQIQSLCNQYQDESKSVYDSKYQELMGKEK